MKILYFDCFSGISGDMTIGALLDLGIDRDVFLKELSKLDLDGYRAEINTKIAMGISGTDFNVVLTDGDDGECSSDHNAGHGHGHEHGHIHDHDHTDGHSHDHDHTDGHMHANSEDYAHYHEHSHSGAERNLPDIEHIFETSRLSGFVKAFSKRVFREIAEAEAKVHGKTVDEVHFHEVGAVDSIVDIAGTAICLELLGAEKVVSSVLHDGSGFIHCRHGIIPVPVPAVMEMLSGSGIPLVSEDVATELVTPTGMGLIKCMASEFGARPPMTVEKTGYGLGKRNTGRLNALRIIFGELYDDKSCGNDGIDARNGGASEQSDEKITPVAEVTIQNDEIAVLETNMDDVSGETLGYTMSKLMDAGALDAFYTPIYMKKNRPAYMLTVLAKPGTEDIFADIVFRETTTLGIRTRYVKRLCMDRKILNVSTPYGDARVKVASYGDMKKVSPEYEDCRKIAEKSGLSLSKACSIVTEGAAKQYGI